MSSDGSNQVGSVVRGGGGRPEGKGNGPRLVDGPHRNCVVVQHIGSMSGACVGKGCVSSGQRNMVESQLNRQDRGE